MYKKVLPVAIVTLLLFGCAPQPATAITVTMTDFAYSPSTVTVPAGQPVVLTIKNDGQIEHDFVVEKINVTSVSVEGSGVGGHHMSGDHIDYDLHVSTSAGGTSILKFSADEPGTYRIFCSIAGHIEAGMLGELIVAE